MKSHRGLSLIELMIAITLGLVVLSALVVIFANSSRSRTEMERSNRQIENGRYAAELLATNLRMAGYLAEFDPSEVSDPAALPDPCATATADLITALPLHVQGANDATNATKPSCISDLKIGTDILVVRRSSACVAGSAGCAPFQNGAPHIQASLCTPTVGGYELAVSIPSKTEVVPPASNATAYATHYYTLDTSIGAFTKHKNNCTTSADIYRYHVHIYFVANNNEPGDGIPTLKRAELGAGSFSVAPLVEGIEQMQIDYGIDTDSDGVPNGYTQNPSAYASCSGIDCVKNWRNVMAVRVHLLARNIESSVGYSDSRTFALGFKDDGSVITAGVGSGNDITLDNSRYKRHVFTETVRLANPSWRRQ